MSASHGDSSFRPAAHATGRLCLYSQPHYP